jgi:hypothetical protein
MTSPGCRRRQNRQTARERGVALTAANRHSPLLAHLASVEVKGSGVHIGDGTPDAKIRLADVTGLATADFGL